MILCPTGFELMHACDKAVLRNHELALIVSFLFLWIGGGGGGGTGSHEP